MAERERDRARTLSQSGAMATESVEQAEVALQAARAGAEVARATVRQLQSGSRVEEVAMARGGLSDAEGRAQEAAAGADRVALRAQQVEEARASAAQARAELAVVEVALDRTVLRAAIDGVVVRVGVDPGDFVATGQTAVSLADPGHAWVSANVEETEVAKLRPGQEVQIAVDEGGELHGRVEVVGVAAASQFALIPADSASGNFTKVVQRIPIRVALSGAHRPLRVGQSVTIRIRVR